MKSNWAEGAYAIVIAFYPREFRDRHGHAMKLLFRDLLHDSSVGRLDLATRVLGDVLGGAQIKRNLTPSFVVVRRSAIFGLAVLAIWIICRQFHPGVYIGVALVATPFMVFLLAGFAGSRTTRTFSGGILSGFITGLISALTVPGDYLLFHSFPYYDVMAFAMSMFMAVGFCVGPTVLGAAMACFADIQSRMRRSANAFAHEWQVPT